MIPKFTLGTYRNFDDLNCIDKYSQIIDYCFSVNIKSFDTSRSYANGNSEKILGLSLKEYPRSSFVLSTKVYKSADNKVSDGLNNQNVRISLFKSIEALKVNFIDIYYLHRFDPNINIDVLSELLISLYKKGYFKNIGLSMWPYDAIIKIKKSLTSIGYNNKLVIQDLFNIISPYPNKKNNLFLCKRDFIIFAYSPFARGILKNSFSLYDEDCLKKFYDKGLSSLISARNDEIKSLHCSFKNNIEMIACQYCFDYGFDGIIFGISKDLDIRKTLNNFMCTHANYHRN